MVKQTVDINVKEREVQTKEVIIEKKTETKLKPVFILSGGVSATANTNMYDTKPALGIVLGIKTKEYTVDANYNTNGNVTVLLKRDIFTLWGKDKK